jgi:hypothetical protein
MKDYFEIPNLNIQNTNKFQFPKFKIPNMFRKLDIVI